MYILYIPVAASVSVPYLHLSALAHHQSLVAPLCLSLFLYFLYSFWLSVSRSVVLSFVSFGAAPIVSVSNFLCTFINFGQNVASHLKVSSSQPQYTSFFGGSYKQFL